MGRIPGRFGKTVKNGPEPLQPKIPLKEKKKADEELEAEQSSGNKISRRNFLKYGVGAAAVAAGATALMGKIPLPAEQPKTPPADDNAEPIVASVSDDQLTVMSGQVSVKVKVAEFAAKIEPKLRAGN